MVDNPVGHRVVHISIALGVIDAIAVALRMLARWRSNAVFAADDVLIIASLIPLYAMTVIGHLGVEAGGMGLPIAVNIEMGHGMSRVSTMLKILMSAVVTYTLTITLVKISLLVLYRRIFSTAAVKKSTLVIGAAVILWFTVALFTNLFQCRPFEAAFDPELLFTNHCNNLEAYYRGITASGLCIDVAILYLPLHMVWGLKLRTRQKIGLSGIFLLGGVACVAGVMRIVTVSNLRTDDLTYTVAQAYIWSHVEPSMAIFCACLMTLRPLFVDLSLGLCKLSTSFNKRSKRSSLSEASSFTGTSQGDKSRLQLPSIVDPHQKNNTRFSSGDKDNELGQHTVTVDLGLIDHRTDPWVPVSELGGKGDGDM